MGTRVAFHLVPRAHEHGHRPALAKPAGHHEAVPPVVALAADHDRPPRVGEKAKGRRRHGGTRVLHEHGPRNPGGDGGAIGGAHLVGGEDRPHEA
jgi:hypothetical protein